MTISLCGPLIIGVIIFFSSATLAVDLTQLTPSKDELPEGVSLATLNPAEPLPKWLKGNPQTVKRAEDRQAALRDFAPEKLDLPSVRSLVFFGFDCRKSEGFNGPLSVFAVELTQPESVNQWRATVEGAMTQFRRQKVRFVARGRVLLWFVFPDEASEQSGAVETTMKKKLDALLATETINTGQ